MKLTRYHLQTAHPNVSFTAAVVADLHDRPYAHILSLLEKEKPDCIFVPGDLCENLERSPDSVRRPGLGFLKEAVKIAPTFYSFGNHETGACHANLRDPAHLDPNRIAVHPAWREQIHSTGAILLDESWTTWQGITIGGLGSGLLNPGRKPRYEWIEDFSKSTGYKLLLCHHPEYFDRYLREYPIDLIVSGHAHGGQWRIFGRGVYAPDQHLFPRYTSGIHENRLVISRGVVNSVPIVPRLFNPCELVMITVTSK